MLSTPAVLVTAGLVKHYGNVVALDGCDLRAERGRMLGLLGPNGAGKTTAMRAVFGLVRLDAGRVSWDGAPVGRDERVRFGYMPEQRGLYPKMRITDQLSHLARLHGLDRRAARSSAWRWLDELGLSERAHDALETLSHGNQQRVQLAAALVHGPELLVLDEPFSGLDPLGVEAMERVLRAQAERGVAIVFSSHQLDLVESLCDDVVVVAAGRDILAGSLHELRRASASRRVVLGFAEPVEWPARWGAEAALESAQVVAASPTRIELSVPRGVDPAWVLAAARAAGPLEEFTFQPPTLSELFAEAVGA